MLCIANIVLFQSAKCVFLCCCTAFGNERNVPQISLPFCRIYNDGFDFSCFSASLPYLNIYFAMPCTMYLLSRHTFVKQENNYCCRSLSQSRIFCFCNCSVLYSGPPVSVMVMLLFSQKIKTVFMLKAQYQKIITRI